MTKKELTIRERILQARDLPVYPEVVPEWDNVTVYVRSMTAKERDDWQASYFLARTPKQGDEPVTVKNLSASLLVKMLCSDPEGKNLIFTNDDIDALGEKSAAVINRLQEAVRKASGTSEEDQVAIVKNSEGQKEISG